MSRKIDFITLGCAKNLVDSEYLLKQLELANFQCYHNPTTTHGDIAIVNTCGFILDAQQESIQTILQLGELKKRNKLNRLYVMGCLSERFKADLQAEIPEVDAFFGKFNYMDIVAELLSEPFSVNPAFACQRTLTNGKFSAYIKIAEGCDRTCSYCAIPLMVGKYKSRPQEEIIQEMHWLVSQGVKEFNVVAQDICYYGLDLYHEQRLPYLVEQMAQIEGVQWLRLHYAYPTNFPIALLDVMAKYDNICKYLDIPFQHCSDNVLQLMRRHISAQEQNDLIHLIRQKVPNICLRTTLLVGHPGEAEEDFLQLLAWVKEMKFEHLGVFTYCEEQGTFSQQNYKDSIPQTEKERRKERIMEAQETISLQYMQTFVVKRVKILVEKKEKKYYLCRTEFDSPEVDCEVMIESEKKLQIGDFYEAKINDCEPFVLYGTI